MRRHERCWRWTARHSGRFQYLLQLVPPSLTIPVAAELDTSMWQLLEVTLGFTVPRKGEEEGLTLQVPEIPAWHGLKYQEAVVCLPVRLYGWGLRSLEQTCGPAYLGGLETAVPHMAGQGSICPHLAQIWGGPECWGEGA